MAAPSKDNVVLLADRRRPQTARPIDPASLSRIYDGPQPPLRWIEADAKQPSRWRQVADVAFVGVFLFAVFYFAAEIARAYLAGNL